MNARKSTAWSPGKDESPSECRLAGKVVKVLFDAHQLGRRQTGNETYVRELLGVLGRRSDLEIVAAVESRVGPELVAQPRVIFQRVPRHGALRLAAMAIIARRSAVDLVHAIYFAPAFSGRPLIVTIHDISYEIYPEFFSRGALLRNRLLIRDSARRARMVVTDSETSRRDIIERYHLSEDRVVAIPIGASRRYLERKPPPLAPIGDRPVRVLVVGNLQPRKNLVRLLGAVRRVAATRAVSLRVIGPDGYQAHEIRRALRDSAAVEIVGYVDDARLAEEYARADVFAYPSIYEGFGLPVLEAMASGVPVVTTTGGSLPEVAGDAALIVDPFDETAMADAILRLAADADLRRHLRDLGRARAAQFSWERAAARLVDVYRDAMG